MYISGVMKLIVMVCSVQIEHPLGPCEWNPLLFSLIDKFGVNWCIYV